MANRVKDLVERNGSTPVQNPDEMLVITSPKERILRFTIVGTAPLVQHRFGEKARNVILETQQAGSQARKGKKREPKDFDAAYQQARHIAATEVGPNGEVITIPEGQGWDGIHAGGFRRAMIDACSVVGFHMTKAKKTVFVMADGWAADGTPLVRITKGEPRKVIHPCRNASGVVDLRARPMWDAGWEAIITIRFDADMFSATDILNLLSRVGAQCGVGEGRANSKGSTGCDWGSFRVEIGPTPTE
jgi:hypothetical protein